MKSFTLWYPECPRCGCEDVGLDWRRLSNLWRVPAAVLAGLLLFPVGDLGLVCSFCGHQFLSHAAEQPSKSS